MAGSWTASGERHRASSRPSATSNPLESGKSIGVEWATLACGAGAHSDGSLVRVERVTGIGGVFVLARDPAALSAWYARCLGVDSPPLTYEHRSWRQEAGPTVFAPMNAHPEHLPAGRSWALNFRVSNLDAMVAQLRSLGVDVRVHEEGYPNGRFADLHDPEGNSVQLWEPGGIDEV